MSPYQASEKLNNYILLVGAFVTHGLALAGLFIFWSHWRLFPLTLVYLFLVQTIGITLGYHRCLAHRSFEFKNKFFERVFTTFGCCGMQMGPIWWCSIHRLHHKHSDTPQDPHDSFKGFWYSHFLWIFHVDARYKSPIKTERYCQNVKDIYEDPYYRFLDAHPYVPWLFSVVAFYLLGGWPWVFWGGLIPFLYHHHVTWMVNSVSHRFGYRTFETKPISDRSTNNWLVGLLAFGEGWHNNHHAFPSSSKHGFFKWWEFDLTFIVIWLLNKMGLVRKMIVAQNKLPDSPPESSLGQAAF